MTGDKKMNARSFNARSFLDQLRNNGARDARFANEGEREDILSQLGSFCRWGVQKRETSPNVVWVKVPFGKVKITTDDQEDVCWVQFRADKVSNDGKRPSRMLVFWMNRKSLQSFGNRLRSHRDLQVPHQNIIDW